MAAIDPKTFPPECPACRAVNAPPEGCKLLAVWGGDGWCLEVLDPTTNGCLAILEWPDSWPEIMTADQLRKAGFETC